jgi:hypothetical protein
MDELNPALLPDTKQQRPTLLTVLCILTFIGSGMNLFSSLIIAGFYELFMEIVQEFGQKFNFPGTELLLEMKPAFFLVNAIFYAGSLVGAIFMMQLKKTGFHIYTIAQVLLLLAPMYFLNLSAPGLPELLFTGIFVLLYGMHLKIMA